MSEVVRKYQGTIIGILFITFGMLFFLIMQVFQIWTNPPDAGPTGFCEYFDPNALVGEPINAWSNFYYVAYGMIILISYDLIRMGKVNVKNKYFGKAENTHYLIIYGLLIIWIGSGSFYMHAAYRGTPFISGHFLDVFSMNLYLSGLIIMSLGILFDIKKRTLYILILLDIVLMVILMKANLNLPSLGGGGLFELLIVIALINEIFIGLGIYSKVFKNKGARQIKRNILILPIVILVFLLAFWVWHFGLRDAPTCDPYSWWQWHAVWHFTTGLATLVIAYYILTEKEIN